MVPVALFLHGFTHTGRSWEPVIAALPEGWQALAPDLRGHGSAAGREPVSLSEVLTDLGALGPERFTLAGYSMGGRLALHLALARPRQVQRLVLVGASPGLHDDRERAQRRQADETLAGELERMDIEAFALRWARTPVLAGVSDAVAARAHAERLRNRPDGLARALRGLGTGALPPLWDRLPELTMPVTLIVGERDAKFRAIAGQMAQALADVRLVVVPGTGHAVHLEAPARVAAEVAAPG